MNIPVFKPYIEEEEINAAVESLRLGWLGPGGYVKKFEEEITAYLGLQDKYMISVNTGTSAVQLALKICNVSQGDEVITPSFNNIADFQCIKALNADPVFCDIQEDSLTMDPNRIEELISKRTKAIICLDYGSSLCDYESIKVVADKHHIPLIHDAAHAFGSSLKGQKVGSYSDICTFSFDPVKNITCIDGGAIIVNSPKLAEKLQYMRLLGQKQNQSVLYENKRSWTYDVDDIGYRYHLANLHAAIGIQQMKKIKKIEEKRKKLFNSYIRDLPKIDDLILPTINGDCVIPFIFVVRVLNKKREGFRQFLLENGIDTGIHWQPGHKFSFFKDCRSSSLTVTNKISEEIVSLPFYPEMAYPDFEKIIQTIKKYFY
ncbi:MAG: DegT/DnrJ/EryC1/StrS family aminotransferase [Candidatus Paracaedibacter sp.]